MKLLCFTTPTCGPCKRQKEVFEQYKGSDPTVPVDILDATAPENKQDVNDFEIFSVPTLVLVDDSRQEIKRNVGVLGLDKLKSFLG